MRSYLTKGQKLIGRHVVELPNGGAIELEVVAENETYFSTTFYVNRADCNTQSEPELEEVTSQALMADNIKDTGTCAFCNGKKLGCCAAGYDMSANCTEGTISCTKRATGIAPTYSTQIARGAQTKLLD